MPCLNGVVRIHEACFAHSVFSFVGFDGGESRPPLFVDPARAGSGARCGRFGCGRRSCCCSVVGCQWPHERLEGVWVDAVAAADLDASDASFAEPAAANRRRRHAEPGRRLGPGLPSEAAAAFPWKE